MNLLASLLVQLHVADLRRTEQIIRASTLLTQALSTQSVLVRPLSTVHIVRFALAAARAATLNLHLNVTDGSPPTISTHGITTERHYSALAVAITPVRTIPAD